MKREGTEGDLSLPCLWLLSARSITGCTDEISPVSTPATVSSSVCFSLSQTNPMQTLRTSPIWEATSHQPREETHA